MGDLYFNELSSDYTLTKQPKDKEEAKYLLLNLIKTSFAYMLSCGWGSHIYLLMYNYPFSSISLFPGLTIKQILTELEADEKISADENVRFKAFISGTFQVEWSPEYLFHDRIAYGLGESNKKDTFCISFANQLIDGVQHWNHSQIPLVKITADRPDEPVSARNITNIIHVISDHEIWRNCKFINISPTRALLPNKTFSKDIIIAFNYNTWDDFYTEVQQVGVSTLKKAAIILATVNGWRASSVRPRSKRLIFEAENWFLTVDTRHATFEVYLGIDEHKGEIKFHDDSLIVSKRKKTRSVYGKKGRK